MKLRKYTIKLAVLGAVLIGTAACHDLLDNPAENKSFTEETDYTKSEDMILPLIGAYAEFNTRGWEDFPLISVRGDDVNHGGLGDQQDFAEADKFNYNKDFWMFNSIWQNLYADIFDAHSAMEQIELYKEFASNQATADQYIAEAKTLRAWLLFQLSRVWGDVFITTTSDPSDLLVLDVSTKAEVMQHISDQMDEAISNLPAVHPNERADIPGGVTKYTALAIKAMANLELKNYQGVADATSQIISSGKFSLDPDFYNLFKIPGKLNDENLMELQFSDFGQASGDDKTYDFEFFGPQGWTPKVAGAGSGWGFYEPSLKWIKFMLDRGERTRLETSVLFTNRGIAEIKKDPNYNTLPGWISNTTPSGDVINDFSRALFSSGKHYLPSDQLTPGRTRYGTNKNLIVIRYAEILLMHAEALTQGATSSAMTADAAVNAVRARAGLGNLSGVTHQQVMDEKFAELAMEWGIRYYDMARLGEYGELSYEGRSFSEDLIYLPYPQNQLDLLPNLGNAQE
ncbi:RagB/SusD family nutrient uptake outer membrane protein [Sunxiuqinia sp. sy24]|uniref:RagB/SusD family nutrient uptake outer membrane protein n=1 Tax=Sunxiuqinia sp. sy24 TaxID=3461495 RepID=UPI00404527AB